MDFGVWVVLGPGGVRSRPFDSSFSSKLTRYLTTGPGSLATFVVVATASQCTYMDWFFGFFFFHLVYSVNRPQTTLPPSLSLIHYQHWAEPRISSTYFLQAPVM